MPMKKSFLIHSIFTIILLTNNLFSEDTLISKALHLFETRWENPAYLNQSAQILESVILKDSNNLLAHYKLAQIYYTIADRTLSRSEKLNYFEQGLNYAKKAIAIDSNSVWAHFWYMANLGGATQLRGIFSSLASISEVKKELDLMLKLDPNNVWVLNAQANYYMELPAFLGGDLNKSIDLASHALKLNPNYTILYITLAKAYIKKKDYTQARLYLKQILDIKNPYPLADYLIDDRPTAIKLLEQIKDK